MNNVFTYSGYFRVVFRLFSLSASANANPCSCSAARRIPSALRPNPWSAINSALVGVVNCLSSVNPVLFNARVAGAPIPPGSPPSHGYNVLAENTSIASTQERQHELLSLALDKPVCLFAGGVYAFCRARRRTAACSRHGTTKLWGLAQCQTVNWVCPQAILK